MILKELPKDFLEFGRTLGWYSGRKAVYFWANFEGAKGLLVSVLKARRGTYQKPFLHVGMILLVVLAVSGGSVIINQYPTKVSAETFANSVSPSQVLNDQADITNIDTITKESDKPRRDVVEYTVLGGDTLSTIAQKFSNEKLGIDIDSQSIATLNDFPVNKVLKPGDVIKIPPVSGIIVTVKSGDTINSLAKKYGLESAQPIVDWPYNSFADDEKFALTAGQTIIIPGGKPPEVPKPIVKQVQQTGFLGAPTVGGTGKFIWPVGGVITQYFSWYHTGLDIAGPIGTPVVAADSGRVVTVLYDNHDYGYHVMIDHGNGYTTLYGHLSRIDVSLGQNVSRGEQVGLRGSTGRSTGPHLHFEIRNTGGGFNNPSAFLK